MPPSRLFYLYAREMENAMSDYLAGMVGRSEHQQMTQSLPPVLDFDRRGHVERPGWLSRFIGRLLSAIGRLLVALGERLSGLPIEPETPCLNMDDACQDTVCSA